METLVVVAQHKNHCYGSSKSHPARYTSSRDFRGINCRTFHSGSGILPTPIPAKSYSTPTTKCISSSPQKIPASPKIVSPEVKTHAKSVPRTLPITVNGTTSKNENTFFEHVPYGSRSLSELWAGPAYSNSPPPSSLPIPKFSLLPKRTVSLDLPHSSPEVEMPQTANSAPPSPRDHGSSTRYLFLGADSATKNLRRILNLDIEDE